MVHSLRPLAAALLAAGCAAGAHAQASGPEFRFSGFGTLGVVHSDERHADFTSTIFQPNGAGETSPWSYAPDSKLGAQVDAVFNPQWSAVLQLVSQHRHTNNWTPQVEWLNVKYQATPEWSVRLGRIAAPSFLVSETRYVGYSQPWVRPPVEVYGILPITSNDGIDASWKRSFGEFNNTLQGYWGRSTGRIKTGSAKANPSWGLNDSLQWGDATLRAGYSSLKVDLNFPTLTTLVNTIGGLGALPAPTGPAAAALAQKYGMQDMRISAFSLGASYDPGRWFAMAEFVQFRGSGFLTDSRSWYGIGGYRFGPWTPYAGYARTHAEIPNETIPGAPAALVAGLNNAINNQFNSQQSTATLGVRWDFVKNAALKVQYDHVDLHGNSAGRQTNVQPALVRGGNFNLFSVALDFVF